MARKRDTGEGEKYSSAEEERVAAAIEAAYAQWGDEAADPSEEPSKADVKARIEWAGTVMPKNNGMRRTKLDLPADKMKKVRAAVEKVQRAKGKKEAARPSVRYKAKSPRARWNEMRKSKRGQAAMEKAGLAPSKRTQQRWAAGGAPGKEFAEKIDAAYEALRTWNVTEAGENAERANKEAADAFTDALKDKYGVNIRLRDIEDFTFE